MALRIAVGISHFWLLRGYRSEGAAWLEEALATATTAPAHIRSLGHTALSELAYNNGDRATARQRAEAALTIARQSDDAHAIAESLLQLGKVARVQGFAEEARRSYSDALAVSQQDALTASTGSAFAGLGDIAAQEGALERARELYEQALACYRAADHPHAIGSGLLNGGAVALHRGRTEDSTALYREALAIYEDLHDDTCSAEALAGLAEVRREEARAPVTGSELREAAGLHRQALVRRARMGQRGAMVTSFEGLAQIATTGGDPRRAARLLGFAEALRETTSTPIPPAHRGSYARLVSELTGGVQEGRIDAAWKQGRVMTVEQAVAYALEPSLPHDSAHPSRHVATGQP